MARQKSFGRAMNHITKTRIHSFPPIANKNSKVLILGSMPSEASLLKGEYYGHPKNLFWLVMANITGIENKSPYELRVKGLKSKGIALWDVLKSCCRDGSLDSGIDESSIEANDFAKFFHQHRKIRIIFFNGAPAERYYRKYVLPLLNRKLASIEMLRLPSTSPANASWSAERKIKAWSIIAKYCRDDD